VNGTVRAPLVVGAGGHFCPVARWLGARVDGREQCVAAQEIEFLMTPEQEAACKVRAEVPELFFTPDLIGYGWAFRKGHYLNIGLGREDNDHIGDHVQAFRDYLVDTGRVPDSVPGKFKGHAYLLYHHAQRALLRDGVLLIGDAVGLAYPESGEGIRPAVESGLLAGRVIEAAKGDYSQAKLADYEALMKARFGERQPGPSVMERLPSALKLAFAAPLMQSQWFLRKVLVERWFLHRHLPPLSSV
jgi:flavin-dependent dehydrogenase